MAFLGGLFGGAKTANKYLQGGINIRNEALGKIQGEYSPWTQNAGGIQNTLEGLLGIGGNQQQAIDNFRNAPGYQAGMNEGVNAIDSSQAAKGLGQSGATLKALDQFGQDYADRGFQQYFQNVGTLGQQSLAATGQLANAQLDVGNSNAGAWGQMGTNKANQANANLGLLGSLAGSAFRLFGGM